MKRVYSSIIVHKFYFVKFSYRGVQFNSGAKSPSVERGLALCGAGAGPLWSGDLTPGPSPKQGGEKEDTGDIFGIRIPKISSKLCYPSTSLGPRGWAPDLN
jgi:hypothetical protein